MSAEPTPRTEEAAPPLDESLRDLQERLAPKLEEAKERLADANEKVKGFIRENPGVTLLGAVAIGFVIGRLASRR